MFIQFRKKVAHNLAWNIDYDYVINLFLSPIQNPIIKH